MFTPQEKSDIAAQLAAKHQFSLEVVQALLHGLRTSGGTAVQFNHPELGGMGQWMPSMMMIGDMNNHALKARVDAVCRELSAYLLNRTPVENASLFPKMPGIERPDWYPAMYGTPTTTGKQNDMEYAYFAAFHRFIVKQGSTITLYDTLQKTVTGVSQQQMDGKQTLVLHTPEGIIAVGQFPIVKL